MKESRKTPYNDGSMSKSLLQGLSYDIDLEIYDAENKLIDKKQMFQESNPIKFTINKVIPYSTAETIDHNKPTNNNTNTTNGTTPANGT